MRAASRRLIAALAVIGALLASNPGSASAQSTRAGAARGLTSPAEALEEAIPEPEPEPFPIGLDIAGAINLPLSAGLEVNVELPFGFLVRGHVGLLPEPFVEMVNEILVGTGAYSQQVGAVVRNSGAGALVLRAELGIRPFQGYGFEILAGYTHLEVDGTVHADDYVAASPIPLWIPPGMEHTPVHATIHAWNVMIGWSALIERHFVMRVGVGWTQTFDATTSLQVPSYVLTYAPEQIDAMRNDSRNALLRYGFTPELRIALGYRF